MDHNDTWLQDLTQYISRLEQEAQQFERVKERMIKNIRANEMYTIDEKIKYLCNYQTFPFYQKAWNIISVNRKKENEITILAKYIKDLEQKLDSIKDLHKIYYQGRNWID